MKVEVEIVYRHFSKSKTRSRNQAEEKYAFEWQGNNVSQLFQKVSKFDDAHTEAEKKLLEKK